MEIRENDNLCIFAPLSAQLNEYEPLRLQKNVEDEERFVGIDLQYVQDCTIDFIYTLKNIAKKKRIGVFNIPSDIFTLFNIMDIDRIANLFVSELDFKESQRQLLNRKFSVVR